MFKFLRINKLNSWLLAWTFWFFNGMIVSQTKKLKKICQKREIFVTKFSKNHLKLLKFTYFVDNASKCIPYQMFFGKLKLFLPDSQKSRNHVVYLQNFSISVLESTFLGKICNHDDYDWGLYNSQSQLWTCDRPAWVRLEWRPDSVWAHAPGTQSGMMDIAIRICLN